MLPDTAASKVTAAHLSRTALLYVRQSSLKQVIHNTESAIRQYDLRGKAIALGWDASQITVTGIDQGQSGASAADREGFQQLVAEVSLGRAGIVLGLECSRLARNSADWHQLLELCGMTGTLICDETACMTRGTSTTGSCWDLRAPSRRHYADVGIRPLWAIQLTGATALGRTVYAQVRSLRRRRVPHPWPRR